MPEPIYFPKQSPPSMKDINSDPLAFLKDPVKAEKKEQSEVFEERGDMILEKNELSWPQKEKVELFQEPSPIMEQKPSKESNQTGEENQITDGWNEDLDLEVENLNEEDLQEEAKEENEERPDMNPKQLEEEEDDKEEEADDEMEALDGN